jgi:RNA polymerase sigma factor (TIGR02999 family)
MPDLSRLLDAIQHGDPRAASELLPLVYDELRKLAADRLAHEKPGQTLQATALLHEAYLRLVDQSASPDWNGRGHFFAAAATAMRRILVEQARRKRRAVHGGTYQRVEIEPGLIAAPVPDDELLALDEALAKLAQKDPQKAKLVELRYFAGLTGEETAAVLGISAKTVDRHWVYARAWLRREIAGPHESKENRADH